MAKKLTKGMLSGSFYTENFEFEVDGEKYEVEIKALKHFEAAEIQSVLATGVNIGVRNEISVDPKKMAVANANAQVKAAALGTTDVELTEQEIKENWPSEAIVAVGTRVMTISGIGNPEEVERFRTGGK